jgi:hypothetical protein
MYRSRHMGYAQTRPFGKVGFLASISLISLSALVVSMNKNNYQFYMYICILNTLILHKGINKILLNEYL